MLCSIPLVNLVNALEKQVRSVGRRRIFVSRCSGRSGRGRSGLTFEETGSLVSRVASGTGGKTRFPMRLTNGQLYAAKKRVALRQQVLTLKYEKPSSFFHSSRVFFFCRQLEL